MQGKELIDFLVGKLGDGRSLRFWFDRWLGEMPFKDRFLNLFRLDNDKMCVVAKRWAGYDHEEHRDSFFLESNPSIGCRKS